MKFSYKGMIFEVDHATAIAVISGAALYVKALVIDFVLGRNKNLKSNSLIELGINSIKGKEL